ncbi:MAG: glycosyltransferase family 4 protein, partial [Bacilli bacterium]|nr:glycosyltransferase family 4 protein [Bacilli bacterium]
LINNAVDVFRFKTYRCYYNKGMVIGHIGRYNPVKNHQTIIAVYRQLLQSYPDLQLRLVGDGLLFPKIEKEIANLKNVYMIKKTAQVEKQLAQIDIFLLPSVYEGMPLSIIEAMASGAVIVASRVGGITDIIENGVNGYLIDDCYDIDGFVTILHHLLENKAEMTEISKKNVEKAQKYDIIQLVLAYENLYTREVSNVNG